MELAMKEKGLKVKRTSVVRRISRACLDETRRLKKRPASGDVIKARVAKMGFCTQFENVHGRLGRFFEGHEMYVVFGTRYATAEFEAKVPPSTGRRLDLLNAGGVCGKVVHRNIMVPEPTKLEYCGHVVGRKGKPANIRDYAIPMLQKKKIPLVIVVGSDMDAGKTTSAASVITALVNKGYTVNAGKMTGVARRRDSYFMKDAGAKKILDFVDAGYPSTYKCSLGELMDIFWRMYTNLGKTEADYIVMELADGILERETSMLLSHKQFTDKISRLIMCAGDAVAARGGVAHLRKKGLKVDAVSGKMANTVLAAREFGKRAKIPVFGRLPEEQEKILKIIE